MDIRLNSTLYASSSGEDYVRSYKETKFDTLKSYGVLIGQYTWNI